MALATGLGMAATARPRAGMNPVNSNSAAQPINAPTASAKPPGNRVAAARKADPGVDQATAAGIRVTAGSQMLATPMPKVAKNSPVAACAGLAPIACRPASTMYSLLAPELTEPCPPHPFPERA